MRTIPARLLCSAALLAGVALGACADEPDPNEACGDTIITRTNPNWDFSTITTFAVVAAEDYPAELPGDLPHDTTQNIVAANSAARASLIAQGLLEVNPDFEEPDVWLFSLASTRSEVGYAWACVPGYAWWGWWGWDYYCPWWDEIPIEYEVGTVVVGLAKLQTEENIGEVVFGGAVQGVLNCDDPRERVQIGVAKIFAQYPAPEPVE
jgi:hypothetical protein